MSNQSENKDQKVGMGKFVAFSYKLYDDADGKLLFETPADAPDVMVYGVSEDILPGLVAAMDGLKAGDKFETVLPAEAAFGHPSNEYIMSLDRDIFTRDGKLADEVKVGKKLPMMTAEGFRVEGVVTEIGDDKIKMDFNHPFAGRTVRYEGVIDGVRDATPEELQPRGGCCGGGCCGGGDSDSSCGCDSGCGGGCGSCQ